MGRAFDAGNDGIEGAGLGAPLDAADEEAADEALVTEGVAVLQEPVALLKQPLELPPRPSACRTT